MAQPLPARVLVGHWRLSVSAVAGVLAFAVLPGRLGAVTRAVIGWDVGAVLLLVLVVVLFSRRGDDVIMAQTAERQQEGEWTMFGITLAGVLFSFLALTTELGNIKRMPAGEHTPYIVLASLTLLLSWLVTHMGFALRYAHEYYTSTDGRVVDGGLEFPGTLPPDYWDFSYFSLVLGMTFQVSDVQITSRKMRRLATVHGLIGFLFNTVIVALTVNIAAGLLN